VKRLQAISSCASLPRDISQDNKGQTKYGRRGEIPLHISLSSVALALRGTGRTTGGLAIVRKGMQPYGEATICNYATDKWKA
jgi:hypothetical protein